MISPAMLLPLLIGHAVGHGVMMSPTPRQPDPIYWYQVGCMTGCNCSGGGKEQYPSLASVNCNTPATAVLETKFSTWNAKGDSANGKVRNHIMSSSISTHQPARPLSTLPRNKT